MVSPLVGNSIFLLFFSSDEKKSHFVIVSKFAGYIKLFHSTSIEKIHSHLTRVLCHFTIGRPNSFVKRKIHVDDAKIVAKINKFPMKIVHCCRIFWLKLHIHEMCACVCRCYTQNPNSVKIFLDGLTLFLVYVRHWSLSDWYSLRRQTTFSHLNYRRPFYDNKNTFYSSPIFFLDFFFAVA